MVFLQALLYLVGVLYVGGFLIMALILITRRPWRIEGVTFLGRREIVNRFFITSVTWPKRATRFMFGPDPQRINRLAERDGQQK